MANGKNYAIALFQ